jgi:DNA polymerase elongation subunit (family B)
MDFVSAWERDDFVHLIERKDTGDIITRRVPARWTMFIDGVDDEDRAELGRDPRVVGVNVAGDYTRIDFATRWGRREILDALDKANAKGAGVGIYEADVGPIRRLLSDEARIQIDPNPRLGFMDLETDSRKTFAEMKRGHARILSWAVANSDQEMWSEVLDEDSDAAEVALLKSIIGVLTQFDCVLAWNGSGFDFEVLESRCEVLGVNFPHQRWTWLDHLQVFKKYNMHSDGGGEQKSSFKLGHVAMYLLGEGKDEFDASKTWEAWEAGGEERERLLKYNEKDTLLLPRIEAATGFLSLHLAVCHICRLFPDTESLNATAQGDGFLLRLGDEHGFRWATKRRIESGPKFKGAYVMEPTKLGAIDSVHVADFAGLYPSIMRTFNMSPDTKVNPKEWTDPDPATDAVCKLPNRNTFFETSRDGMFRIALNELVEKRAEYTAAMKAETPGTEKHSHFKRLSGAFKIVANSFFWITGSPFSRFFDVEIAEGVTQTGRWLLEQVIAASKDAGLDPFYGDTDSVFVQGDGEKFREVVVQLNTEWADRLKPFGIIDEHHIDLDFEKSFKRLIMVSAKRYAGRFEMYKGKASAPDASHEVKGLEFKRGDTIRLAREFQSEVVTELLRDELPEVQEMMERVAKWKAHVLEDELPLADFIITQSLSKPLNEYKSRFTKDSCEKCGHDFGTSLPEGPEKCRKCKTERKKVSPPAHVRIALEMRERGITLDGRVAYVIGAPDSEKSKDKKIRPMLATDPDVYEKIDRNYYWDQRVNPAVARVLDRVYPGIPWADSSADVRERRKGSAIERNRGKIDDLPLFAAPAGVTIQIETEEPSRLIMEALRAAVEAHPGTAPVVLEIRPEGAVVEYPTGLSVARTPAARAALERVVKKNQISGF